MFDHINTVVAIIMAVCSLAGLILGALVKLQVWQIKFGLAETESKFFELLATYRREATGRSETLAHSFGEIAAAIRQKIHEFELFCRDTYVRRDSFYKVGDELKTDIEKAFEKIEKKLDGLEAKLDKKADRTERDGQ